MRREGSFHDDHPFHGTLDAYRHTFGAGVEGVMSIADEAAPGALGVSRVECYLEYRCMAI
jgi:hypothetical protein